jgi:hypothetical protein
MSSAVLKKRGLRPQEGEDELRVLHGVADVAKALIFRRWQYAEMVDSPYTMEWNSLRRKIARGSLLVWKIPSMATHRSRAVGSALSMARSRTESSTEPES